MPFKPNKIIKIFFFLFLLSALSFSTIAKAENKIIFTKSKTKMTAGKSFTFQASVTGSVSSIIWSVSNDKASITQNGRLTAKKAGKTHVIARSGGLQVSLTIQIRGKKMIAIDPGHQGKGNSQTEPIGPGAKTTKAKVASGTTGKYTKVPEYILNLAVAKKLRKELLNRGYEVVMTRTRNDVNISNRERALFANQSGADICIRIHANGASSSGVYGALALYPSTSNPYVSKLSNKSRQLSSIILNSMCKETGAKNLGPMVDNNLTGTNWSKIPVTVIEMGFMSNEKEDRLMQTTDYQKKLARGIAKGIDAYYN